MAEDQNANVENNTAENDKAVVLAQPAAPPAVLSGADKLLGGSLHVGVAVQVTSDGKPSTLMITDITKIAQGYPIYITKPIRIKGANLATFLEKKQVALPDAVKGLIGKTSISCEAFYYAGSAPPAESTNNPAPTAPQVATTASILLMVFALQFNEGLIKSLTGDEALGALFDIEGASVRLFQCPEASYKILQNYVAELEG
jgi:hypothetical protein